jgi:hypothetical protein
MTVSAPTLTHQHCVLLLVITDFHVQRPAAFNIGVEHSDGVIGEPYYMYFR